MMFCDILSKGPNAAANGGRNVMEKLKKPVVRRREHSVVGWVKFANSNKRRNVLKIPPDTVISVLYTIEKFTIRWRWFSLCLLFTDVSNTNHRGLNLLLWLFCYNVKTSVSDGNTFERLPDSKTFGELAFCKIWYLLPIKSVSCMQSAKKWPKVILISKMMCIEAQHILWNWQNDSH